MQVHRFYTTLTITKGKGEHFFTTNQQGDFLFLGFSQISKYNGLFYHKNQEMYKIIANIILNAEPYAIANEDFQGKRIYNNTTTKTYEDIERLPQETFVLTNNGLIYRIHHYKGWVTFSLDMRKIYDFHDQGRYYTITQEDDKIIIHYEKKEGEKKAYDLWMICSLPDQWEKNERWYEEQYRYDQQRKDDPFSWWVYDGFKLLINNDADILITYGTTEEEAREKYALLQSYFYEILSERRWMFHQWYQDITTERLYHLLEKKKNNKKKTKETITALSLYQGYLSAKKALFQLITSQGIYAGLPWFFQIWTRDEAIAFGAFLEQENYYHYAKFRLFTLIKRLLPDGRIPNRTPKSALGSADGVGWVFFRLWQFFKKDPEKILFSQEEREWLWLKLQQAIARLQEQYGTEHGFLRNNALETWMDTAYKDDTREGIRLEIQVLLLKMYQFAAELGDELMMDHSYWEAYKTLKGNIKSMFFFGNLLADGKGDHTIRPNIFLAAYLVPELLKQKEWEAVMDNSLPKLWCSWGGISTIEKQHPYFHPHHTGIDNRSYHRGDSWFWINHYAALVLFKLNAKKYKPYIKAIIEASLKILLTEGAIGALPEIASCETMVSYGCWNQAWSNSTFIELLQTLFQKGQKGIHLL